jgi:hypothetical protein
MITELHRKQFCLWKTFEAIPLIAAVNSVHLCEQIQLFRKLSLVRLRRFISGDDAVLPA